MCTFLLRPIGVVRSSLEDRDAAPKQGSEGAPDASIDVAPEVTDGLEGIEVGDEIVVVTWLHQARRDMLKVHPRGDTGVPLEAIDGTPVVDMKPLLRADVGVDGREER